MQAELKDGWDKTRVSRLEHGTPWPPEPAVVEAVCVSVGAPLHEGLRAMGYPIAVAPAVEVHPAVHEAVAGLDWEMQAAVAKVIPGLVSMTQMVALSGQVAMVNSQPANSYPTRTSTVPEPVMQPIAGVMKNPLQSNHALITEPSQCEDCQTGATVEAKDDAGIRKLVEPPGPPNKAIRGIVERHRRRSGLPRDARGS